MKSKKKKIQGLPRPPIVVVLGHVDHGKTTLLDYIRKSDIAAHEQGQITQHIGAYQVAIGNKKITFIDTPGHEAFAKMRSRGAKVADLAILVVAADDGVMPQTIEAIRHIKEAKIPMIVAINKVDLPGISLDKAKKQLIKEGVSLEEYGGNVVTISISAKTGKGINELLEMILLVAEMEELKAEDDEPFEGVIIESKLDRNCGPLASLVVKKGILKKGDEVIGEHIQGRVRSMTSDSGERLTQAAPSTPVEISGLEAVPQVGLVLTTGKFSEEEEMKPIKILNRVVNETKLKMILKVDVEGSLEAIINALPKEKIEIISCGTGDISTGNVLLAKTTGAIIIGFNVKISSSASKLAETEHVSSKIYQIIYNLLEEISEVVEAILKPPTEEALGKATIIAEFAIENGKVAGCKVIKGRLATGDKIKLIREEKDVSFAKIKSLKKQKESVNKVDIGGECGVFFEPPLDFLVGDSVLSYR